ncbi:unnamed protein product [Brachionus calyciflorus]|uniref:Uncharacterized protein n=1 Tax=Brachionus calyciflorus TaxID=104777 RepID=A0A813ZXP9_9BILA|nr:unnamed protein product [Brachionus calyciflorus]
MNKNRIFKEEISALKIDNHIDQDRHKIAKSFNEYFKSVLLPEIDDEHTPKILNYTDKISEIDPFKVFIPGNVERLLRNLKEDKYSGPDNVSALMLKKL